MTPVKSEGRSQGEVPAEPSGVTEQIIDFLRNVSIETTPHESATTPSYREYLPLGTSVYITFVAGSDFADVIRTARRLRQEGLNPVPHLTARSIASQAELEEHLRRLRAEAEVEEVLVIAGDLDKPLGPYHCTMQVLETGLFDKCGIRLIGVAGHPEGNRDIGEAKLNEALAQKNAFAKRTDAQLYFVTQFCFEAAPIVAWDKVIRAQGNRLPIHVGLPGTATLKSLIGYARACGVGPSVRALKRQTGRLARLAAIPTPDRLVTELARYKATDPECGIRQAHFYPLGALKRTARWVWAARRGDFVMRPDGKGFTANVELD